jgi:hypothetical protein
MQFVHYLSFVVLRIAFQIYGLWILIHVKIIFMQFLGYVHWLHNIVLLCRLMVSALNKGLISDTSFVGLEIGEKQEPRTVSYILIDTDSRNSLISGLFGREYVSNGIRNIDEICFTLLEAFRRG